MSVKIEEKVKAELLKVAGEYQTKLGKEITVSDAIDQLIREHRKEA